MRHNRAIHRYDVRLAVEFLTVFRLRRWSPAPVEAMARAQAFYPLVGLALGALLALIDAGLTPWLGAGTRAALLVAALAAVTRGLHLDGLADTFDGLLGGHDRERRLAIMRDPRLGSFGATALVLTLLVKWSALAELAGPSRRAALLLAPALARYVIVVVSAAFPYARAEGLGAGYRVVARGLPLAAATLFALAMGAAFALPGLILVAVAVAAGLLIGAWAWAAVGGVTGDTYGAACEVAETVALLAAVAWASRSPIVPWWSY